MKSELETVREYAARSGAAVEVTEDEDGDIVLMIDGRYERYMTAEAACERIDGIEEPAS